MNNVTKIILSTKIYNLEAILSTCYTFIDRAYIFLDSDTKGEKVTVSLKGKKRLSSKKIEQLKGELMNELLHFSLRHKVNKNNRKIREFIVSRAIYSALPDSGEKFDSDLDDPLGIAIPWEEKYGKAKKNAKGKI